MEKLYLLFLTLLITLLFFVSGLNHLMTLKQSTQFLSSNYPFTKLPYEFNYLVLVVSSLIEVTALFLIGFGIMYGQYYYLAKYSAYALAFFLFCTILFIHNPFYKNEFHNFLKNSSFLGGVLLLGHII